MDDTPDAIRVRDAARRAMIGTMPFDVLVHDKGPIIEVVYPERPSAGDVTEYVERIKRAIDAQPGGWACLVDQRRLVVMPPDLVEIVGRLNAYAQSHGMRRTARVVGGAVAKLQTQRMAREANLSTPLGTFDSREAALAWLRQGLAQR